MVRIPNIKIPSVRVGGIDPTSDIGTAIGGVQPTPITYLTQWKIVGNSEVKTLPYPDGVVLPQGYKRCEYLQSDGTAYIEVPFGFDKTDEVYAKAAMLETGYDTYFVSPKTWNDANNRWAMGVHKINKHETWITVFANAYGVQSTYGAGLQPYIVADNVAREWEYKNYICSMGGSVKDNSHITFGSETQNLRLFFGYNTPTQCQIYEYRHKKANTEYRLIPCLDSNDTPCMYDVINNQAYYNSAGSGSFTYKLYPQPTEIWSCGEYNATDGKWHILVQPQGGSIADIALTEPLRKVNNVADTIEFPSDTEGKALVTRKLLSLNMGSLSWSASETGESGIYRMMTPENNLYKAVGNSSVANILCPIYNAISAGGTFSKYKGCAVSQSQRLFIYDPDYNQPDVVTAFTSHVNGYDIILELAVPTTELVDAPQIAEAESYSMVISQGGKAVEWSSFSTDSSE